MRVLAVWKGQSVYHAYHVVCDFSVLSAAVLGRQGDDTLPLLSAICKAQLLYSPNVG